MDLQKRSDEPRQAGVLGDRRAWEAIAIVLLICVIAWPTSGPPPPNPVKPQPAEKSERPRAPPIRIFDLQFDALLVEASLMSKPQAQRQVSEWLLKRGLPKIEFPQSLLGKQEAVTMRRQRKIGVFFLPPGAENYRFWTDARRRTDNARGDEHISRNALEQPPGKPCYLAWADDYNERLLKLVSRGATCSDWQQFANDCETWQQQLVEYREQWGVGEEPDRSARAWSFREAAATARNVVRLWPQYEQALGLPRNAGDNSLAVGSMR